MVDEPASTNLCQAGSLQAGSLRAGRCASFLHFAGDLTIKKYLHINSLIAALL